jgi:LmbE family N-acetylglucosaminyl deacetylase
VVDPVVILSPHLDDAVLSCGQMMAGRPDCVVVTIFAGYPHHPDLPRVTPYDEGCGFTSSVTAVNVRREEDQQATMVLRADYRHLDFLDGQYGMPFPFDDACDAVIKVLADVQPEYVLAPLGIEHPDHARTCSVACSAVPAGQLHFYEELPGRVLWPDRVHFRHSIICGEVRQRGVRNPYLDRAFLGTGKIETKKRAIDCYLSQTPVIEALGDGAGLTCCLAPERFWKVQW